MEEVHNARRSSGIYDGAYGGGNPFGSTTSLPGHGQAAGPSGLQNEHQDLDQDHGASGIENDAASEQNVYTNQPREYKPAWFLRRWFLVTTFCLSLLGLVLIFVLLYPLVRAIAQHVLNVSELHIDSAVITSPTNGTFALALTGVVWRTGVIYAQIHFNQPINVSWLEGTGSNLKVVPMGYMELHDLYADHKQAPLNDSTTFVITDQDAFGRFTQALITQSNFTWRLNCPSLRVKAVHFPVDDGLVFQKDLTIPAINNFQNNIILKDLKLPGDAPEGGIQFVADTILYNPSPFAVALGDLTFNLTYDNMYLGQGKATSVSLVPQNNTISLAGTLVPHTSESELLKMSKLFTNYINGVASDVIAQGDNAVYGDNGQQISWLTQGLQSLVLHVPFKPEAPLNPIKTITIGTLNLDFTAEQAWAPRVTSNSVQATLQLPFGFNISVENIVNNFNLSQNGLVSSNLVTPLGAATSNIKVLGPTNTEGTVDIVLANGSVITSRLENHAAFSAFTKDFTDSNTTTFSLIGAARAQSQTPIGLITLDPINVNVSTSLKGVQGLQGLVVIKSIDVMGGTADHLNLAIVVNVYNPSSLILSTGDLSLQLSRDSSVLGAALLPDLHLALGNNTLNSTSTFNPNAAPIGLQTLDQFVGGTDVPLKIAGYSNSTDIASLLEAFESLNIDVVLPGLKTPLINTAALVVLPTTGRSDNISHVTVTLANPFTSPLQITSVTSSVTSHGIPLGKIASNTSFTTAGNRNTTSPSLDLDLNFDPSALLTLTRRLAVEAGESTAQLDGITAIGGYKYLDSTDTDSTPATKRDLARRDNIYTGFNLVDFVSKAFKGLRSDIEFTAGVTIGEYPTQLNYNQSNVPVSTDSTLIYILNVLATPIVQKLVDGVTLSVDSVLIENPEQLSFNTALTGSIGNAGPFDAVINTPSGLTVSWNGSPLGNLKLDSVNVVGDVGASLDVNAAFTVADVGHLTDFTKVLLNEESFVWSISGSNLSVTALGITIPGIDLPAKEVTLKGFNGLKNAVTIQSFDLPQNSPDGGIELTLQTTVNNPSQVGISLSTISFDAYSGTTKLGPVASTGALTLSPGTTSPLALAGRLIPQTTDSGLAAVSKVFNNFVQGQNSDVSVTGTGAGPSSVTWLNDGIKTLSINTVLPNQGKLDIIKSIALNELTIDFTEGTAYNPATSTSDTAAAFTLPFAFPVDITALDTKIVTSSGGTAFAVLDVPRSSVSTDVGARIIAIRFQDVPFAAYGDKHSQFSGFVAQTTTGNQVGLELSGSANTAAGTAIGTLQLTDIAFNVQSSIMGLQGLNARAVTVANLDVVHGYSDYLLITVDTALYNPSNLTIGTGNVNFDVQFDGQTLGTANLDNLVITPGSKSYATNIHFQPSGGATQAGKTLLENYISGIDSATTIQGTRGSTPIDSLKEALSEVKLSPVNIPSLHQNLILSTGLVFPTDIVKTGIASATFTLQNPFTASINIKEVTAQVTYNNLSIGEIDHQSVSVHADGHSTITSPNIPFKFTLDPVTIISLIASSAQANGVDLGPLPSLFQVVLSNPSAKTTITTSIDPNAANPSCVSGQEFPVAQAILNALKGLKVNLALDTSLALDDYATSLQFKQNNIPAVTDSTALYLIGAVAPPIVQGLVNGANLVVKGANITNLSDDGFDLALTGSLTNIGPLDAQITFVEPLIVTWQNRKIAKIALPPVCAAANTGVPNYTPNAKLTITDLGAFTDFATYILHNEDFTWDLSTTKLRVTALGTIFDDVVLEKTISLKAFNNLPGVFISNFQLPSDDSAGGIHITTDVHIPSPAQLGIDLGTVVFDAYYDGVRVGPLTGTTLILPPTSTVIEPLSGRIVPQSGADLDKIGVLFSDYLQAKNISLNAKGVSVVPTGSNTPVSWLSTAFKTLDLPVTLMGQKFTIIQSITINDFELSIKNTGEAYNAPSSSNSTLATYKNPFGFSLAVIKNAVEIVLAIGGTNAATLSLPSSDVNGGVSTGNVADLPLSFKNIPLKSINDPAYQTLLRTVTDEASASLTLAGTADVVARTAIGDVPISGINFSVPSTLKGINGFSGKVTLTDLKVTGSGGNGGNEYVIAPLISTLDNPAPISLSTTDISLPVFYLGTQIGRAVLNPFNLVPGTIGYATEFRYEPADRNDTVAQSFLSAFLLKNDSLPAVVKGDGASSPYGSLIPALEGLSLAGSVAGLGANIITKVYVTLTLDSLITNQVEASFDVYNPLDAPFVIEYAQADAKINGVVYATFAHSFDNFVVPAGQVVNSGVFGPVDLPQGAANSLDIINMPIDIFSAATARVGAGGYQIPFLRLDQLGVPTEYTVDLPLLSGALGAISQLVNPASSTTTLSLPSGSTSITTPAGSVPASSTSVASSVESSATGAASSAGAGASSPAAVVSSVVADRVQSTSTATNVSGP